MRVFEKIKIKLRPESKLSNLHQFRLFGFPVLQLKKINNKKNWSIPFLNNKTNSQDKLTVYLKVNREDGFAFLCMQHWLDIIGKLDANIYIICDKKNLELRILRHLAFHDDNFKFLKSSDSNESKEMVKKIFCKRWAKAAFAHLKTFEHSKAINAPYFWNIDADDTMFLTPANNVVEILKEAQNYAIKNDIDAFSFDMWFTRTYRRHWSFGITFTNNKKNWFEIFKNNLDPSWQNPYKEYATLFNLDWLFTSLRDSKIAKNETFYIDNMQFIHWGDFFTNPILTGYFKWENNKLIFPILHNIYKSELGIVDVASDCVKLNYLINSDECTKFAVDYLTNLNHPMKLYRK